MHDRRREAFELQNEEGEGEEEIDRKCIAHPNSRKLVQANGAAAISNWWLEPVGQFEFSGSFVHSLKVWKS